MQYNLRIWFMFWWRWKSYSFTSHEDWGGRGGGERWKMKLWRNGKIIISKLNGSKLWRFCVLERNKSEANWKLKGDARVSAKQRETWKSHLDYCRLVRASGGEDIIIVSPIAHVECLMPHLIPQVFSVDELLLLLLQPLSRRDYARYFAIFSSTQQAKSELSHLFAFHLFIGR